LDVVKLVPGFARQTYLRLRQMRLRNRSAGPVGVTDDHGAGTVFSASVRADIAEGLHGVVRATQFATIAFGTGLVLTLIAILLRGYPQTALQYAATLGFVLAWAAISSGAYQRQDTWLRGACMKTVKWWAMIFVPVGVINLFFALGSAPS